MSEPPLKRLGLIVELKYSDDWFDALCLRLDKAQIADRKSALVTDHMGVEVKPFDSTVFHLDPDHFPLRVFYLARWSLQETRTLSLEQTKCTDTADQSSLEGNMSPASRKPNQQFSAELQFEDVWPGILQIKLRAVAGLVEDSDLRSLVATDTTGVEIDISQHDRIPDPARFPLKLHFRARGAANRQNLEQSMDGLASQVSSNSSLGDDQRDRSISNKVFRDHSTELQLESILADVVSNRMRDMGTTVSQSSRILVTDCTGVQVCMHGGIPEGSRFPLKFHTDGSGSAAKDRRMSGGMSMVISSTLRLREFNRKSRKFFKRSLSKLNGSSN